MYWWNEETSFVLNNQLCHQAAKKLSVTKSKLIYSNFNAIDSSLFVFWGFFMPVLDNCIALLREDI